MSFGLMSVILTSWMSRIESVSNVGFIDPVFATTPRKVLLLYSVSCVLSFLSRVVLGSSGGLVPVKGLLMMMSRLRMVFMFITC